MNKDNINEFASFDEYLRQGWWEDWAYCQIHFRHLANPCFQRGKHPNHGNFHHPISPFVRIWSEQRNVCQTLLVFPQCPGSCQLSKHSERHWLLSYLPGSFLQELTPKRWLGSQEQIFAYPADWWLERAAKNRYPTSTPQAILKYPTSSANMWRLLSSVWVIHTCFLRKSWNHSGWKTERVLASYT